MDYKLTQAEKEDLIQLGLETEFNFDCDDLDEGQRGSYIPKIFERSETPGYSVVIQNGRLLVVADDSGQEYVAVAASSQLTTDDFATEKSQNAEKMFDELFLADEQGDLLPKSREEEISAFLNGVKKELGRMYDKSQKDYEQWKKEQETEV